MMTTTTTSTRGLLDVRVKSLILHSIFFLKPPSSTSHTHVSCLPALFIRKAARRPVKSTPMTFFNMKTTTTIALEMTNELNSSEKWNLGEYTSHLTSSSATHSEENYTRIWVERRAEKWERNEIRLRSRLCGWIMKMKISSDISHCTFPLIFLCGCECSRSSQDSMKPIKVENLTWDHFSSFECELKDFLVFPHFISSAISTICWVWRAEFTVHALWRKDEKNSWMENVALILN